MSAWSLIYDEYLPEQERLREALCTLGNGYFASRGAAPEADRSDTHYPGTYRAGCYNRLTTEINDTPVENESLVNLPNWLPLRIIPEDGDPLSPDNGSLLEFRQELDMKHGLLTRAYRIRDGQGRISRVEEKRLVHIDESHLAALSVTVTAENWDGSIEIVSALDGRVENAGVERYRRLRGDHLEPLEAQASADAPLFLKMQTRQSHIRIAQAATTRISREGEPVDVKSTQDREEAYVAKRYTVEITREKPLTVDKTVSLFTSRDKAISECGLAAYKAVRRAPDFAQLVSTQALLWEQLWRRFDIVLHHEDLEQQEKTTCILHLHIFHLLQTASPRVMDLDVGIPARGLHGEAYRGHIFWDELFVFPTLNLRVPEITRALIQYRYRRLDEARAAAHAAGYRGAMYPWQSGSDGREESQQLHLNPRSGRWIPDHSHLQRHVNAAIAYNVWQYYQVTGDMEFLSYYGAEMLIEIARFWVSIAHYNSTLERYEICRVMGPDEYHDAYPGADQPGLDNNTYTNLMAVWIIGRALELPERLPTDRFEELAEQLALEPEELEHWEGVSRRMRLIIDDDGIFSQFEGYMDLEEFDWEGYRERYDDIHRLDRILEAEDDTPNRYKVSKQADVLMLFYLFSAEELEELVTRLGYDFDPDTIPRNIDYYASRTSHGSTLSSVVHSWVFARSDRPRAWELFRQALQSDVADVQGGTTPEGIHTGAMAGTVDLIQRCFTGISLRGDTLWLNPALPEGLHKLDLKLHYRGHYLDLSITHTGIRITTAPSIEAPINIALDDRTERLEPGTVREFQLR